MSPQKTPAQLMREKSELELEQLYLKSRLQLARTDSIYLSLNLPDSTLTIEIKGVPLRECHIVKFKFNFELETKPALANWLAAPFILRSKTATIPKAPIRVKEAPSDTIEAKEMSEIDIPVEKGFVYFTLDFDRNLSVSIAQEKAESVIGWTQKIFHKALTGSKATVRKLGDLVLPGERDYVRVYLEVSGADAKAIYRALPSNAGLAFRPTLSQ
ncbi:MAG: hypothetical protein ONB05_11765 [candidate division KSB1 bacterium]|nr:hypothetical protein [candidate division KSB1 bacterium]